MTLTLHRLASFPSVAAFVRHAKALGIHVYVEHSHLHTQNSPPGVTP